MAEADIAFEAPQEILVETTPSGGRGVASTRFSAEEAREPLEELVMETQRGDMPITPQWNLFGGEGGILDLVGGHECLVNTLLYDAPDPESGHCPVASFEGMFEHVLEACQEEVPVLAAGNDVFDEPFSHPSSPS